MAQSVLKSAASLFAEREPAEEAKKERWEWGGCYSGFRVDGTIPERWFIWTPSKGHLGVVPSTLKPRY